MTNYRRIMTYTLLIGSLTLLNGCFGSFQLTRTIYKANRNVYSSVPGDTTQRKIAQSAVMWLFMPVYAVSGIADAVVFNVIEFWTGHTTEVGAARNADGTTVALSPSADGREAMLTITHGSKVISQEHLVRVSDRVLEVRDLDGNLRGRLTRNGADEFEVQDSAGHTLQTFNANF